MKRNILSPIAAIAAIAFTISGCASSDNQHGTTAMNTTTETQSVTVTETGLYDPGTDTGFTRQYEAETRSGGLVLTDEIAYHDMFEELDNTKSYNLLSLAETSSNLSTFASLLRTAGMIHALENSGSYTLFAPTNKAFGNMPAGKLEHLMKPENRTELIDMLNAHVLPQKVSASQFNSSHRITLNDDQIIPISADQNGVRIGGARVVKQNIEASNGFIHVVDAVIMPTTDFENSISK